jgi:hypothetical protein
VVSQVTKTGMSQEEKLGIAAGAVAFIVVLLFFLVIGNMSFDSALEQPILYQILLINNVTNSLERLAIGLIKGAYFAQNDDRRPYDAP